MATPHLNNLSSLSDVTLWTGGWDSTYRVLQRALLDKTAVHPCYVVDRDRRSTGKEVDTMSGLFRTLKSHHPDAFARIEPPRYVALQAIPPHAEITEAWRHLRDVYDIGSQYDWLARLAEAGDWTGVELAVYGGGRLRPMFGDDIQPVVRPDGRTTWALGPGAPEPQRLLFGRFAFPFWETSKREAVEQADREGLTEILDANTWFCFNPINDKPCGTCRPCQFMFKDGLGHRIPRSGQLRYAAQQAWRAAGIRGRLNRLRAR